MVESEGESEMLDAGVWRLHLKHHQLILHHAGASAALTRAMNTPRITRSGSRHFVMKVNMNI